MEKRCSIEDLRAAVEAVNNGSSLKAAAKAYNIPKTTLFDKVNGVSEIGAREGPSPILSNEEEELVVKWIIESGKAGFPVNDQQIMINVFRLLEELKRPNPFNKNDNTLGKKWLSLFLSCHPTPQNLTLSRRNVTEGHLLGCFAEIESYMKENYFLTIFNEPCRIFNADEAAFFYHPKSEKVVHLKGAKSVYCMINSDEKECLTVLSNVSGSGAVAPPMVLFKYVRVPKVVANTVPKHWGVDTSESGWMASETFCEYMYYQYI